MFGPIAREFNEHHEEPTLDPSNYVENFTKGAYASMLAAALAFLLWAVLPETALACFVEVVATGLAVWAFFFHNSIHTRT